RALIMRIVQALAIAAAGYLVGVDAHADEPTASGIELGVRAGYSFPLGSVSGSSVTTFGNTTVMQGGQSMSDAFTGRLPLMFDAGYRINPNIYVGLFLMYGFMFINGDKTQCNVSGVSCSAHEFEYGLNAHYHFLPETTFDPWLGVGFGFESV